MTHEDIGLAEATFTYEICGAVDKTTNQPITSFDQEMRERLLDFVCRTGLDGEVFPHFGAHTHVSVSHDDPCVLELRGGLQDPLLTEITRHSLDYGRLCAKCNHLFAYSGFTTCAKCVTLASCSDEVRADIIHRRWSILKHEAPVDWEVVFHLENSTVRAMLRLRNFELVT